MKILIFLILSIIKGNNFNTSCKNDNICKKLNNENYYCFKNKCEHKPLEFKLNNTIGLFLIIIISGLCNSGGLGGGTIWVPIFNLIFKYSVSESIPLSKATIFAGALINFLIIFRKKNPENKSESLINYKLGSIIIPLLLSGTILGVLLSKIVPPFLIILLLSIYLLKSSFSIYKKAKKFHKIEIENKKRLNKELNENNTINEIEDNESLENNISLTNIKKQKYFENFSNFMICIFTLLIIIIFSLIRGDKGINSILKIKICSSYYWISYIMSKFIIFLIVIYSYKKNSKYIKINENKDPNKNLLLKLMVYSYFCGIGAGLFGIGGGIILNPILLNLGYTPEIAAALSGFAVLFTSSSTTIQFIIAGAIKLKDSFIFLIFSSIGCIIGDILILNFIRKYNKPSILVWIIFITILICSFVLPLNGFYDILKKDRIIFFSNPC